MKHHRQDRFLLEKSRVIKPTYNELNRDTDDRAGTHNRVDGLTTCK